MARGPDQPHEDVTLKAMAEHLSYEIEMLQSTTRLVTTGRFPTDLGGEERVLGNALLESILIHTRSLDDFLRLECRNKPDDLIAVDYLPEWGPRSTLTPAQRDRINKSVAHLTSFRVAGPKPWPLKTGIAVLGGCFDFLVQLKRDRPLRAAWFAKWIDLGSIVAAP